MPQRRDRLRRCVAPLVPVIERVDVHDLADEGRGYGGEGGGKCCCEMTVRHEGVESEAFHVGLVGSRDRFDRDERQAGERLQQVLISGREVVVREEDVDFETGKMITRNALNDMSVWMATLGTDRARRPTKGDSPKGIVRRWG